MTTQNSYSLTSRQQLVDLNGEMTNFNLTFTVTSKNKENFDVLVVDQTTLDNQPKLDFKRANGTISGNIIADKNVYQNYFLCLKAGDKPCDVTVTIDLKEIQPQPHPQPQPQPSSQASRPSQFTKANVPNKSGGINWKFVLIVIIVVGGGALLWYMYNKKETKNESQLTQQTSDAQPSIDHETVAASPPTGSSPLADVAESDFGVATTKPVAPVLSQGSSFMGSTTRSSLIDRLNSLPLK